MNRFMAPTPPERDANGPGNDVATVLSCIGLAMGRSRSANMVRHKFIFQVDRAMTPQPLVGELKNRGSCA
jgi:hypothetical protein